MCPQELSTLSPWLLRGTRRLLSPYRFDPALGRSRLVARKGTEGAAEVALFAKGAAGTDESTLVLAANPDRFESASFALPLKAGDSASLLFHSPLSLKTTTSGSPRSPRGLDWSKSGGLLRCKLRPLATAAFVISSPGGECPLE